LNLKATTPTIAKIITITAIKAADSGLISDPDEVDDIVVLDSACAPNAGI